MGSEEIARIRDRACEQLMKIPGVHAVGIGGKEKQGKPTGKRCIKVFVVKKKKKSEVPDDELIPAEIEGIPTDVVEMEMPTILQVPGADPNANREDTGRHRPLRGGVQVNRRGLGFGTLGCFARVTGDADRIIGITNHHVLFENCGDALTDAKVGQPEAVDSCTKCCSSIIGKITDTQCDADLDITLIQLDPGQEWLAEVEEIGRVTGTHDITQAEADTSTYEVKKRGRTTRLTGGTVSALNTSGNINKADGSLFRSYQNVIVIQANDIQGSPGTQGEFAMPGDSGSAVLNQSDEVVAILFGKGTNTGLAIPIDLVISTFQPRIQLEIATAASLNDVQTVPQPAPTPMVAAEPHAIETVTTAAEIDLEAARVAARVERDLQTTPTGRLYLECYLEHTTEVNRLIQTNQKVATVWQRSGGAAMFHALVRALHLPGFRLPTLFDGRSLRDVADRLHDVLWRFGSSALRRDLTRVRPTLPDVGGMTYDEIVETLGHSPVESSRGR